MHAIAHLPVLSRGPNVTISFNIYRNLRGYRRHGHKPNLLAGELFSGPQNGRLAYFSWSLFIVTQRITTSAADTAQRQWVKEHQVSDWERGEAGEKIWVGYGAKGLTFSFGQHQKLKPLCRHSPLSHRGTEGAYSVSQNNPPPLICSPA